LSLSFAPKKKNQEMTMDLLVHCHLLHLRKKPRDDDKLFGSSSSFALEEKTKRGSLSPFTTKENVENENESKGLLFSIT
jgi:hypothetical protein